MIFDVQDYAARGLFFRRIIALIFIIEGFFRARVPFATRFAEGR